MSTHEHTPNEIWDVVYECPKCHNMVSLLNDQPNICYECPDCHEPFHTELNEDGELIVVIGCI